MAAPRARTLRYRARARAYWSHFRSAPARTVRRMVGVSRAVPASVPVPALLNQRPIPEAAGLSGQTEVPCVYGLSPCQETSFRIDSPALVAPRIPESGLYFFVLCGALPGTPRFPGLCLTVGVRAGLAQAIGQFPAFTVSPGQPGRLPMPVHQGRQAGDDKPVYQRLGVAVRVQGLRGFQRLPGGRAGHVVHPLCQYDLRHLPPRDQ